MADGKVCIAFLHPFKHSALVLSLLTLQTQCCSQHYLRRYRGLDDELAPSTLKLLHVCLEQLSFGLLSNYGCVLVKTPETRHELRRLLRQLVK